MKFKQVVGASIFLIFVFLHSALCAQNFYSSINNDARSLYHKGLEAYASNDKFLAYEYFHSAIRINPHYVDPIKQLAKLLFEMKQYNHALEYTQKAKALDSYDISLTNLEGRIYIGLAEFKKAQDAFNSVLKKEPNNMDAKLGMCDLHVVDGTWKKALLGYQTILHNHPENMRAILSLALIYDELDDEINSENCIKLAIRLFPDDVTVRHIAANHYRKYNKTFEAKRQASLALQIDPFHLDTALLFSYLLLDDGEADAAVELLNKFLPKESNNEILLYTLAYAYESSHAFNQSFNVYDRALNVRHNDEICRLALEHAVINNTPLDDPYRQRLAYYHFDKGDLFLRQSKNANYYQSYRSGLQLMNQDIRGLKGFAEFYRRNQNRSKYFSLLELVKKLDPSDRSINDNYNIYKRIVEKSIASTYGISQFSIPKNCHKISFYAYNNPRQIIHYNCQKIILDSFAAVISGFQNIETTGECKVVADFSSAFENANEANSDYFFIFDITEKERSLHVKCEAYFARSGVLIDSFSVLETGNDRVQKTLWYMAQKIAFGLPKKGSIIQLNSNNAIINLGKMDGLKEGEELLIVRKDALSIGSKGFSFYYENDAVIGSFRATTIDDYIALGQIKNRYNYDLINEEDFVIQDSIEEFDFSKTEFIPPDLYRELLKIN